jgi:hypothetical protein
MEVRGLGMTMAQQRSSVDALFQRYPSLMAGNLLAPKEISRDVIRIGEDARSPSIFSRLLLPLLGYAANAISIGPKLGALRFNVIGIIADIAEAAEAAAPYLIVP